jgi:hypothetical protein
LITLLSLPVEPLFITDRPQANGQLLRVQPTWLTAGPWSAAAQHGGPPSALLALVIEQHENDPHDIDPHESARPFMLTRLTIDLLRPVPLSPLVVDVQVIRPGKRVQLVQATLWADGEPGQPGEHGEAGVAVARAVGMRVRRLHPSFGEQPLPIPDPGPEQVAAIAASFRPVGDPASALHLPGLDRGRGFHADACELRFIQGSLGRGPGIMWGRLLGPLLDDQRASGVPLAACLSDFGNAVGSFLDMDAWGYMNTDLTVSLHREPVGDWICLDGVMQLDKGGFGQATCALHDEIGPIGRSAASLLIVQQ